MFFRKKKKSLYTSLLFFKFSVHHLLTTLILRFFFIYSLRILHHTIFRYLIKRRERKSPTYDCMLWTREKMIRFVRKSIFFSSISFNNTFRWHKNVPNPVDDEQIKHVQTCENKFFSFLFSIIVLTWHANKD